jgi:hypothetical protein
MFVKAAELILGVSAELIQEMFDRHHWTNEVYLSKQQFDEITRTFKQNMKTCLPIA